MAGTEHDSPIAAAEPVVDLTAAAPGSAAAEVPPELLAQSLGQYLRAWLQRIRSGDSGVLPVLLGIVVVAIAFEIITPENSYLRASNLVYIFGLSTVYVVLATAEIVVLLLGEIDLSIGSVALLGGTITFKLVQQDPGPAWPWWAAILTTLICCAFIGAIQGTLAARLRIPSFVVTLAGFLLFQGIIVIILGGADGTLTVGSQIPNQSVIFNLVQGVITPVAGWIVLAVLVVVAAVALLSRASARRRAGLVAPPLSLVVIRIVFMARDRRGSGSHLPGESPVRGSRGDSHRARDRRRLDGAPPAHAVRPLRLRDRRQPGSGSPRRREPCVDSDGSLRPLLGHRRVRGHPARIVLLRAVQHQRCRPRPAHPLLGGSGGHRRHEPLRRPGQAHSRAARRPDDRRHRIWRIAALARGRCPRRWSTSFRAASCCSR